MVDPRFPVHHKRRGILYDLLHLEIAHFEVTKNVEYHQIWALHTYVHLYTYILEFTNIMYIQALFYRYK